MPARTPYILLTFANPLKVPKEYLKFLNRESTAIYEQLENYALEDKCDVNRIPNATVEQVFNMVEKWQKRKDLVLFHYGGHASGEELLLITEEGESIRANAEGFAELLGSLPSLQLVFLNACSTKGQVDLLLKKGVKAVIATTAPVQDQMAVDFATRFYQNLAGGEPIGKAFEQARKFVKTKYNQVVLTQEESRSLVFGEVEEEDLPWGIYFQEGDEEFLNWSMPQEKLNRSVEEREEENQMNTELLSQISEDLAALKPLGQRAKYAKKLLLPLALIIGIVLSVGAYLTWKNLSGAETFDLVVYFYSDEDKSSPIEEGLVRVIYDQAPDVTYTIHQGQIELKEIKATLRGQDLKIHPSITEYSEKQIALTVPEEEDYLEIILSPKQYQSEVQGSVKDSKGSPVEGAMVIMGKDTSFTNVLGDFGMTLPLASGEQIRMRIIHNNQELYNGEERISSNPINIMLKESD